ncbi:MAG: radical SAM protein [Candidatus Omnitrophica bacterium]|nr:radical SAM protein [Candidatus Omnitrophota bacterium]
MEQLKPFDYIKYGLRILYKGRMMPCYLTFFVTSKCNMRCLHCFYWKELDNVKDELSLEEIAKISKSMGNILVLMLTGGEPTLRPDLADIAEIFSKNNRVLNLVIPTNGYQTMNIVGVVEDVLKKVGGTNVTVNISLDALEKKHDTIRGASNAFSNAIATSNELTSLKEKYSNLNVGICITMMHQNEDEIASTYRFVRDRIKPNSISLSIIRGEVKNKKTREIDIDRFETLSKIMDKTEQCYSGFPFSSFTSIANMLIREQLVKTIRKGKWLMPCYAGRVNAVIYPDGDVYFCELLDRKIGNLRDAGYDFKKIWFSQKAGDVRRFIKEEKCFCIHDCNIYTNILFNPFYFLKMLRKWLYLKTDRILKLRGKLRGGKLRGHNT